MHLYKKILTSVFCTIILFSFMILNVVAKDEVKAPYVISNYKIEINILDNGIAQVKEKIDISNCEDLLIKKIIPTTYQITSSDKTNTFEQTYKISNVNVENHDITTIEENNQTIVNIVLPRKTDSFELTYEVLLNDFQMTDQQLFYYTLFTGFEGSILALDAQITFPKEMNFAQMQLLNEEGRLASDYLVSYEGNIITIKTAKSIIFGTHLSLRTSLPSNYFLYGGKVDFQMIVTILSIFLVSGAFIIYISKEKGNKKKRFLAHPPKDVPMILYGYIVDGYISEKDFLPYLVQWANYGFIWIEETKQDVRIILRQELPPHTTIYERLFFDALFGDKTVVSLYDLENKDFTLVFDELKEIVYDTVGKQVELNIYHMDNMFYQIVSSILAGVPIFLSLLAAYYTESYNFTSSIIPAFFGWIAVSLSCIPLVYLIKKFPLLSKKTRKYIFGCIGILQGCLLFIIGYIMLYHHMNFLYIILNMLMTIFFMLILFVLDRRTNAGSKMYMQVTALDNFIRQSRIAQIDEMLYQDPNYFYNVLPYVCALDLVPVWSGKFTAIMIQKPFWFLTPQTPSKAMYWIEPMVYALDDLAMAILKVPLSSKNY